MTKRGSDFDRSDTNPSSLAASDGSSEIVPVLEERWVVAPPTRLGNARNAAKAITAAVPKRFATISVRGVEAIEPAPYRVNKMSRIMTMTAPTP